MSLPRVAIRRPVAVAMAFTAIIFIGLLSFQRLPIDLLPEIAYPKLVVYTGYSNVAPTEIERFVTERVESAVSAVPGVERVESVSREGVSLVTLRFAWGTDMDFAALNVRERLDNIRDQLPELAARPIVLRADPASEPVMAISASSIGDTAARRDLLALRELAESVIRRRLEQLDGVAQAAVTGGPEREIHVDVDPRLLESHGVTIAEIAAALDAANASAPGGTILLGRYRYSLRTLGEFQSVAEIETVPVRGGTNSKDGARDGTRERGAGDSATMSGGTLLLRDVARITDGFRERESIARYNGHEAIGLLIFKDGGANTVRVAESVEKVLQQLRRDYPEVTLQVASSQASFISAAIDNVVQELVIGGVLAFLILFLFLRDPRYPVAIALAMPISIIATFALFDAFGVTLNIMTLGGLALGIGLLMDNSIVVIENIFRHRKLGMPMREAAAVGTEEVQRAIIASTLSSIAVFGPIIYVAGVAGKLFGALSYAVAFALLSTIVVALVLLPALVARWWQDDAAVPNGNAAPSPASERAELEPWIHRTIGPYLDRFDARFARFTVWYEGIVIRALDRRWFVLAGSAVLLLATIALASTLERSALPKVDQGSFQVRLSLPSGTPLERTAEIARAIERVALEDADVTTVFSRIGRREAMFGVEERETGINTALLDVRLNKGVKTDDVVGRLRPVIEKLAPGTVSIEVGQATAIGRLLGGGDSDVSVRLQGNDLEEMHAYASSVADRIAVLPSLTNVRVGSVEGQPEVRIEIDRERAAAFGINPAEIARVVGASMRGVVATDYVDFDRKIGVVVRLPEADRRSLATLRELRVSGIPLREMVTTRETRGLGEIRRVDQRRVVPVQADVARGGVDDAVSDILGALRDLPPPAGIRTEIGGETEEMQRAFRALLLAFALALLLIYMILAAQFESLVLPFVVLFGVPLALIGAIVALWIAGEGLNAVSVIGLIVLAGIADNDALIKVDFINQARRRGRSVRDAILDAGRARLRPIIINSATAMLGVLPMALGIGPGAELQAPLALAIFGGLFTATALTLVVIPVVYEMFVGTRVQAGGVSETHEPTHDSLPQKRVQNARS